MKPAHRFADLKASAMQLEAMRPGSRVWVELEPRPKDASVLVAVNR